MDDKALQKGKKLFISSKIIIINYNKLYIYLYIKRKKGRRGDLKRLRRSEGG
jgi:hypothetical protein